MSKIGLHYDIEYNEEFKEQVKQGNINPLCGLRIEVNGEHLAGASPGKYHIDDYLFYHFRKVALAIPDVLDGNDRELQLYNVPDYLILHPDNQSVSVALQSPNELEEDDQHGEKFLKEDLAHGVVEAIEEYYTMLTDIDS